MKHFNKLAHAVWQCKYHVVWCPKYRFKILKGAIGESVRDIIKQLIIFLVIIISFHLNLALFTNVLQFIAYANIDIRCFVYFNNCAKA